MLKIKEYRRVTTVQEAYELSQERSNVVIGGMIWLKMQNRAIDVAIDMSGLGLDSIVETEDKFIIGAMTPLRDFETHAGLQEYTSLASKHAVESIVGVQFRNVATIGGSVFGKFGFSDVITFLLALDCKVELYNEGIIDLQAFLDKPITKDILVNIIINKQPCKVVYKSKRNTKTDFPVLSVCTTKQNNVYKVSIGARPLKAITFEKEIQDKSEIDLFVEEIVEKCVVGGNNRGSKEYRQKLVKVLSMRCLQHLMEDSKDGN